MTPIRQPHRLRPRPACSLAAALMLAACSAMAAAAQQPDTTQPRTAAPAGTTRATAAARGAPVVLAGDTLFRIESALGPYSAQERAAAARRRLLALTRNPLARIDSVHVTEIEGTMNVLVGDIVVTTITDADAALAGIDRVTLARQRGQAITRALQQHAVAMNLRALAIGFALTLLATAAALLLLRLLRHAVPLARQRLAAWEGSRIRSLRVQNLEVVSAHRITALLGALLSGARLALTVLITWVYLLIVFSFFPWTRGVAARLTGYVLEPVGDVIYALVSYLPSLLSIIVIALTTYYVLKLIHLIFAGLGSGAIRLSNFYPDWAEPTYKIVRFVAIVLAVILIWPHLPNSDSTAFKGVAAFVGLLLSLGSASAVSNIIGGVVMVYMRPFQIGDRVKIADTFGDVIEKTLLVTRVRTTKNVDITIPNSMVLGSHIINFSSTANEAPLVLNTTVTLGYDTPWRKVHEALLAAARATSHIRTEPPPFVLQTALNDFHISYELNAFTDAPGEMTHTYSELHQNIQDCCSRAGIEILSPAYTAHRDGSHTTIPSEFLPAGYEAPRFGLDVRAADRRLDAT